MVVIPGHAEAICKGIHEMINSKDIHYYLVGHKRLGTTNIRFRDRIGVVKMDRKRSAIKPGSSVRIKQVDWWYHGRS